MLILNCALALALIGSPAFAFDLTVVSYNFEPSLGTDPARVLHRRDDAAFKLDTILARLENRGSVWPGRRLYEGGYGGHRTAAGMPPTARGFFV